MVVVIAVFCFMVSSSLPHTTQTQPGNFLEDDQWLSTMSEHNRKNTHWSRFRDEVEDDYIRNTEENTDVDTTKDPCQNVKCSHHKVCVAQGDQRAMCVNRKKAEHRMKQTRPVEVADSICKPCPVSSSSPVCGSDGHNYASECKLEQQSCLTGKHVTVFCTGFCPCSTASVTEIKPERCTDQDVSDLGERLKDWFQLLHGNSKQNKSGKPGSGTASAVVERRVVASCKDSMGWMFSKLDANKDLKLDQSELAAINLDKYELCITPFFNSCDSSKDGKVSTVEWCLCFFREKPPCLSELEKIQVQEDLHKNSGVFVPSCDDDGYYRKLQCDHSRSECWCVDPHGGEMMGSRIHGDPECDEVVDYSGSGVGWEDEEDEEENEEKEEKEENGDEAEEEEADDGGYIW